MNHLLGLFGSKCRPVPANLCARNKWQYQFQTIGMSACMLSHSLSRFYDERIPEVCRIYFTWSVSLPDILLHCRRKMDLVGLVEWWVSYIFTLAFPLFLAPVGGNHLPLPNLKLLWKYEETHHTTKSTRSSWSVSLPIMLKMTSNLRI